jgi:DnaJ like chaperone protein
MLAEVQAKFPTTPLTAADENRQKYPLLRLKVDYTGFSTLNPQKFGARFVERVANPSSMLKFHRSNKGAKATKESAGGKEGGKRKMASELDEEALPSEVPQQIQGLVSEMLAGNTKDQLRLLPQRMLDAAVFEGFVGKEEKGAIQQQTDQWLEETRKKMQRRMAAEMARADGEVSEVERAAFREFFEVPPGEEANIERFFDLAKRDVGGFETYARQVAALFPDAPEILENVIEGLFSIAQADGRIDAAEADYLAKVANIFGLPSSRFERARAAALGAMECEPCVVLGIDPLATDEQIREAWLRQVRANHPDRLMAQGLPEEAIAVANRKLALINDAYDRLRRQRGLVPA